VLHYFLFLRVDWIANLQGFEAMQRPGELFI
jgi:hypothetical protein